MSDANPGEKRTPPEDAEAAMRRMSRRSFLWAAFATGSAIGGWKWLHSREQIGLTPWPLRRALQFNERIARTLFNPNSRAPEFSASLAVEPRQNGLVGMQDENENLVEIDLANWLLLVEGSESGEELWLKMSHIRSLPRHEMTTELKCIEGWSCIVTWAGARFSDFIEKYGPAGGAKLETLPEYVSLVTPDGGYYVGLEKETALHPQTLLCYEMNGKPLTQEHGAPLRLVTPLKYGVKHIKRIGLIKFTSERPADHWAELGYDWYTGH